MKDPLGKAIQAYLQNPSKTAEIIIHSKLCEDDVIPVHYLFRTYADFPEIEKKALQHCKGKILDVGAGAGAHALYLKEKKADIHAIDLSEIAVENLNNNGIPAKSINFFDLKNEKYDTILMLMNGIGIAGTLSNLENTLQKAKSLLNLNGSILLDSSDISYLYEEEDGSMWMDLNTEYYGDFDYQMEYDGTVGTWFQWLFVDFENLKEKAAKIGLEVELLYQKEEHYLAKLKHID